MAPGGPVTELDPRYGEPDAGPTPWEDARELLEDAELFWIGTVRPDGRPHLTPLLAVWVGEALWFCTGPDERKARNLEANPACTLTTGGNALQGGIDLVVEGEAVRVLDEGRLGSVAAAIEAKYGADWHFDVVDGAFQQGGEGAALVFEVAPTVAFAFAKDPYSQTRYRFEP
jgi:hypothetical protein